MDVILLHEVQKLGKRGETVAVARGYARNFLFPKGLAVRADLAHQKELDSKLRNLEAKDERTLKSAEEMGEQLKEASVNITAAAGDEDKLYGSVTGQQIAAALAEQGHTVEARHIQLEEPLKKLGNYTVPIRIHRDVVVEVQVWIERA